MAGSGLGFLIYMLTDHVLDRKKRQMTPVNLNMLADMIYRLLCTNNSTDKARSPGWVVGTGLGHSSGRVGWVGADLHTNHIHTATGPW